MPSPPPPEFDAVSPNPSPPYRVVLPPDANLGVPLTYVSDGRLVTIQHGDVHLDAFYLPSSDLSGFTLYTYQNGAEVSIGHEVKTRTPDYFVNASVRSVDHFMWNVSDNFRGRVEIGPNVFIRLDDSVECLWEYNSPEDIEQSSGFFPFGYDSPPLSFADAALIAGAGFGRYLRATSRVRLGKTYGEWKSTGMTYGQIKALGFTYGELKNG